MTETMLTRIARAIAVSDGYEPETLDKMAGNSRLDVMPEYLVNAKAALEAVREEIDALPVLAADPGKYLGVVLRESEYGDLLKRSDVLAILQGEA